MISFNLNLKKPGLPSTSFGAKNGVGFTLIEVLVGSFLILIVFLAIFGAYQLALKVISQSRDRITATFIANGEIERIRNLSYKDVGVLGDYPDGTLSAEETKTINSIDYVINTRIDYVLDEADGIETPEDECPNDYKKVEIKVSCPGLLGREVKMVTDIAPETVAQECEIVGGILSVSVFNAQGLMIPNPFIEVKDSETDEVVKTATPTEGKHLFSIPAKTYKVEVSKEGYSSSRTYSMEEVAIPEKPNPIVIEGKMSEISFSIDKLSALFVDTLSSWNTNNFSDSFTTDTNISDSSTIDVQNGEVKISSGYNSGYLVSTSISSLDLTSWEEFSWSDEELADTQILYKVFYFDGATWKLIPDSALAGNSTGFFVSPLDLSELDISIYSQLKVKGELSTTDISISPTLYDWHVSWRTSEPIPIPNVNFNLKGDKIIGKDAAENPVYKYSQDHNSGGSGHIDISNIEWDLYTFTIDPATGLDLLEVDSSPQPVSLPPDTTLSVELYLKAQNSLMITVQDEETGELVFSAGVRLYRSDLSYDKTQNTDGKGKTYFIPLDSGSYNLDVEASGFSDYSGTVSVSGDETKIISLERLE